MEKVKTASSALIDVGRPLSCQSRCIPNNTDPFKVTVTNIPVDWNVLE